MGKIRYSHFFQSKGDFYVGEKEIFLLDLKSAGSLKMCNLNSFKYFHHFHVIWLLFATATSQDCYVPGICVNSEFRGAVIAREINNCMGYCERKVGCRYRSVFQELIKTSKCKECIFGPLSYF